MLEREAFGVGEWSTAKAEKSSSVGKERAVVQDKEGPTQ